VTAVILALGNIAGCSGRDRNPEYQKQLRAFAAAYHAYYDSTRVSPGSLDDLKKDWATFPQLRSDIQSGLFVVFWGVSLEQSAAENDRFVLGYEVDVPQNGGLVLLGGGTVRQVSADEFAQLGRFKKQGTKAG
jgi:hypothetical protein